MTQEQLAWNRVALVAGIIIAVIAAGAFALLWRGPGQEGQQQAGGGENVWVQYTADFKLLETSDNQPIDNLGVIFFYPRFRLENGYEIEPSPLWENIHVNFSPSDTRENLPSFFALPIPENAHYCRELWLAIVGKICPNDEVCVETWFFTPKENLVRLTLKLDNSRTFIIGWPTEESDNVSGVMIFNSKVVDNFYTFESKACLRAAVQIKMRVLTDGVLDPLEDYRKEMSELSDNALIFVYLPPNT